MTSYAPLTAGLHHVKPTKDINPGDAFIVRFKNSARDYKTDIWIGVRLADQFEPVPGLSRRPNGAKPVSGEWTTPPEERVYPIYFPGRNL